MYNKIPTNRFSEGKGHKKKDATVGHLFNVIR